VPRPTLAVPRRREQPVDELFVRQRVGVCDEVGDLLGRRREAGQVEVDPSNQRAPVGFVRRGDIGLLEASTDEGVDRALGNRCAAYCRQGRPQRGLEGPVLDTDGVLRRG
jgi:hypothetical protein